MAALSGKSPTVHRQGGSGKLYYFFFTIQVLEPDRPSSSPVELPGKMFNIKLCIEWCRVRGL